MDFASVADIANRVVTQTARYCEKREVRLILSDYASSELQTAETESVFEAVLSLVQGSVQSTPRGGTITLSLEQRTSWFAITLSGIGVDGRRNSDSQVPHAAATNPTDIPNSAMAQIGQNLVKATASLVERLQGQLVAESDPAAGITVTLLLPMVSMRSAEDNLPSESLQHIQSAPENACGRLEESTTGHGRRRAESSNIYRQSRVPVKTNPGKLHVLLVDDIPANIGHLRDYLQAKGHHVTTAENGFEAIERAQVRPDIIFMDVQMPQMDGIEAIERLRADEHTADLYIVTLTSFTTDADRERCIKAGANDFESKPVSLRRVLEMVEQRIQV